MLKAELLERLAHAVSISQLQLPEAGFGTAEGNFSSSPRLTPLGFVSAN